MLVWSAPLRGSAASLGIETSEPVSPVNRGIGVLTARLVLTSGAALALGACASTGTATVNRATTQASTRTARFCHALVGALERDGTVKAASTDVFERQLEAARTQAAALVAAAPNSVLAVDARGYQAKVDAFYAAALAAGFSVAHLSPAGLRALAASLTFYRQAGPWAALHCAALPTSFGVHVNV